MLVLSLLYEVSRKIYIDFVFSGLSCCFHDDLVGGGVDVMEIILLMQRVFFLYVDMEAFNLIPNACQFRLQNALGTQL